MYIPPSFLETDPTKLHDFIEQHSFATLISSHDGEPVASHLPLLLDREAGPHGRLIGHMARANSHWQMAGNQRALAIYHGPHAYVSPGWIAAQNVVPTWNYVTVHAHGTLRLIEDRDRLRELLQRTVTLYDCWTRTPEEKRVSVRFLESLVGDSAFARQLVEAGLADHGSLAEMRRAFADWDKNPVSLAAEAWTEAVAWKPMNAEGDCNS